MLDEPSLGLDPKATKEIFNKTAIQQNETIDLIGYESGIYIISIQTDENIFTTKILKE